MKISNVQYKFTEVLRIFTEKVMKELEVSKLAFSKFLYNNLQNSTNTLRVFLAVCYHQLCSPETGKKSLSIL